MRWTLRTLIAAIVIATALLCVTVPMVTHAQRKGRVARCAANLHSLSSAQEAYEAFYGGGLDEVESGSGYWLALTRHQPPLLDASTGVLQCPVRHQADRATDYRGPARPWGGHYSDELVGADCPGNHGPGRGGNIVSVYGEVVAVGEDHRLWRRAEDETQP